MPFQLLGMGECRTTLVQVVRQLATKQNYFKHSVVRHQNMLKMSHDTLVVGIEPILFLQVVRLSYNIWHITYDIYVTQCTMQINAIQCNAICGLSK